MRGYKVYIFPKNTAWGIEKDPRGNNVYKNVVNFVNENGDYDESLRDEFIKKYLMNNEENFKDKLNDMEWGDNNFTNLTETTKNFTAYIDIKDGNNTNKMTSAYTSLDTLANADFCVVENFNEKGNYKFYVLSILKTYESSIDFTAELDIFFTHQIANQMFIPGSQSTLNRGHIKRYTYGYNIENQLVIKINWDKVLKHQIPDLDKPNLVFNQNIIWKDLSDKQSTLVSNLISEMKWYVFYIRRTSDNDGNITNEYKNLFKGFNFTENNYTYQFNSTNFFNENTLLEGNKLPYIILVFPIFSYTNNTITLSTDKKGTFFYPQTNTFINFLIQKKSSLIITIQILSKAPFKTNDIKVPHYTGGTNLELIFDNSFLTQNSGIKYTTLSGKLKKTGENSRTVNLGFLLIKDINYLEPITGITPFNKTIKDPIELAPTFTKIEINKWEFEGQPIFLPYIKFDHYLERNGLITKYYRSNIENIKYIFNFSITTPKLLLWLEQGTGLNDTDGWFNKNYSIDFSNNKFPTSLAKIDEFERDSSNKVAQQRQNIKITGAMNQITSGIQIAKGFFKGDVSQVGDGIWNFAQTFINQYMQYGILNAQIRDLKNQPALINLGENTNLDAIMDKQNSVVNQFKIRQYNPLPHIKEQILDDIKRNGYNQFISVEIKDIVNCRKGFNYIEADGVFTNIAYQLSSNIKEQIGRAFSNGLYVWHYRGAAFSKPWRGISNFDIYNEEIDEIN